jgi:hypothetical protein
MTNELYMNPSQHGGSGPAVRSGHGRRRWLLRTLVALSVGVFAAGGTLHAQSGPGGGGGGPNSPPIPDLVGTWVTSLNVDGGSK